MKPDNITPKLAEFVGIMLGDGYISYPKQQRVKISFNSIDDKEYLVKVTLLLKELFESKIITKHRSTENCSELYLFRRKDIRKIIHEVGLIPSPKWNRAVIPNWIFEHKLTKFVLRGYFDTDGCVVITNNNGIKYPRLEMKISPSPMQEQFIRILKEHDFRFGVYKIGKGKVRIQLNGKNQLQKWMQEISFSNQKHMRKAKQFV